MLRNVLAAYVDSIKDERDFDVPFLTLLSAMGCHDIHYTHGSVEFGKDFIAKHGSGRHVVQCSFQLKAGDVDQRDWRDGIMGQMLEAATVGLSHPSFDTRLKH